jgi:uncharacterized protein
MFRFLACTFGFSWGLWGVCLLVGGDTSDPLVAVLYLVAGCGPSLVAGLLTLTGRPGTRQAQLAAAPRWLPAALVVGLVPAIGAAALAPLVGGPGLDLGLFAGAAAKVGGWLPYVGLALITGPLAEEFGWRGYLQPLLRRRLSAGRTPFVLGPIWAVWHVPLFMLVGTFQHEIGLFTVAGLGFFVIVVMQSVGYLFVTERLRGGVPAAVLVHLAFNMSIVLVPLDSFPVALIYLGLNVLLALVVCRLSVGASDSHDTGACVTRGRTPEIHPCRRRNMSNKSLGQIVED